jgi:two-component system, NtrC family, response regulator PilR
MSRNVLIVDDEQSLLDFLSLLFADEGWSIQTAPSMSEARRHLRREAPDLVLCDVMMPDGNGLELLEEIRASPKPPPVIMMTAYSSTRSAIEAMRLGAYDYVAKPFDVDELKVLVDKALAQARLVGENLYLKQELAERYRVGNLIGKSPRMQEVFRLIERVARTASTVMIEGESGTGKELVARAIHFSGPRSGKRFLSVNCGAMPEPLLESELFGHDRGAFTGAVKEKRGLFQEASGGSLFLDEIGDMPLSMQVKLLRVLQEKTVRKVGANKEEEVDVRVLAATNRNLEEMVEAGTFREDLYYRIHVIPVRLPPLRERIEDIPLLVEHFLDKFGAEMGLDRRPLTPEALRSLERYSWPGNVRELENVVERTLALSTGDAIGIEDLPEALAENRTLRPEITLPADGLDLDAYLDEVRITLMAEALERTDGVQTQAAELLNMSFRSFRYYAKKAGLRGEEDD